MTRDELSEETRRLLADFDLHSYSGWALLARPILSRWHDEAARPADAPTCDQCEGKGWVTPDDVGRAVDKDSELYCAGWEHGMKMGAEGYRAEPETK